MNKNESFALLPRRAGAVLLAALCLAAAGCTSVGGATRPAGPASPSPAARAPSPAPATSPAPVPAPTSRAPSSASPGSAMPNAPAPGASAPPARAQSDASSASDALLRQSQTARAAGSYAEATGAIERALRLDPSNAELWLELGEIHLAQGNRSQAASMARKALTLTGGDALLERRADRLLRAAGAG